MTKVTLPGQNQPISIGGTPMDPVWYQALKFLEKLQPLSDVVFPPAVDISGKSNITRTLNLVTGTSYTLALADAGNVCWFSNGSPVGVLVPPNSSVAFPVGTQIDVIQWGGKVTFSAGSGVTLSSLNGYKSLAGQFAGGTLLQMGANSWVLMGSLTTP